MAKKQNKDLLKQRDAKRRRKAVSRKQQLRTTTVREVRTRFSTDFPIERALIPKLSEVILDYATPLTDTTGNVLDEKNAISLSVFCWNASLFSPKEGRKQIEPALDEIAESDRKLRRHLVSVFDMMYIRKQSRYANDQAICR